jgi:hypothetical protein
MNTHVRDRLKAIQQALIAHYKGGLGLPSALIGSEREYLINDYLSEVLPHLYRFGRGAITDSSNNICGQLDVVIELPFGSTFPMPAGKERLYLAESVAAVIEVKSNLYKQWNEVAETTRKVKLLNRDLKHSSAILLEESPDPIVQVTPKIPCYAVGYTGYKSYASLVKTPNLEPLEWRVSSSFRFSIIAAAFPNQV